MAAGSPTGGALQAFSNVKPVKQQTIVLDENEEYETSEISDSAKLFHEGFTGLQYTYIDPDLQYQRFLCIVIQVPSGVDPMDPNLPDFEPELIENGKKLKIRIPVSPLLLEPAMLTHPKTSWMKQGDGFASDKTSRLGGLGPAVVELKKYLNNKSLGVDWELPLSNECDAIVGNYSISNFPSKANAYKQFYYPVFIEFKLKLKQQEVQETACVKRSVWIDDDNQNNDAWNDGSDACSSQRMKHY